MPNQTKLKTDSKEEILEFIRAERSRALTEIENIEYSTRTAVKDFEEVMMNPLKFSDTVNDARQTVMSNPWKYIGIALAAGVALGFSRKMKLPGLAASSLMAAIPALLKNDINFNQEIKDSIGSMLKTHLGGAAETAVNGFLKKVKGTLQQQFDFEPHLYKNGNGNGYHQNASEKL